MLPAGTVCLSRTASVGYVVQMAVPMCTSQDFVNWVCGAQLDPNYLRYLLMSEQETVRRVAYGTTHQTMYYPDAKALHILIPSVPQQRAVAEVLGALDDKIAANDRVVGAVKALIGRRLAATLRDGSKTVALGEVARFHNSKRVPLSARQREERRGSVPYWGANGVIDYVDEPIFDEPLLLVGEDGSVQDDVGRPVTHYVWGPTWVNNHAHVLTGVGISTELLRYVVDAGNVAHLVTGAVQPKLSMGNLKRLELAIPTDLGSIEPLCKALQSRLVAATQETRQLAEVRNTLLPHLMSGRITVREAEKAVEGVL